MPGKVEAYMAVNNNLINSYWECNLPRNYQKPGPNASGHEVTSFLTDKYVNKRWVDKDMKHDPLYLYENKRSRFDKFVKRHLAKMGVEVSDGDEDSDEPVKPAKKTKQPAASTGVKPAPRAAPVPQPVAKDLISLTPSAPTDNFTDFV